MIKSIYVLCLWLMALPPQVAAQSLAFSTDSAYANVRQLSVGIGPRPMGSQNEQKALAWAIRRFQSLGADTAYLMPIQIAIHRSGRINTASGVAVGTFRGRTDSIIVIGGHLDSAGPEIPGANDDASGTACVIELARIWRQRPHRYTLVFACFGGEEQNLIGSKYFVSHFPERKKIALMLQIDMAGSNEAITPFLEVKTHQAPAWLVRDTFTADRKLGYKSLSYPTHFFSINNALGGAGSDHEPFLQQNIPALDLTAGMNTSPIHTPQDRLALISKPALKRSGDIVDQLLQKYNREGIPGAHTGHYMLWQWFGWLIFIPHGLILAVNALALFLGVFAFFKSHRERQRIDKAHRIRFSALKVLLLLVIVVFSTQLGEAILQELRGIRYPWMVHFQAYFLLALLCALAGFWVAFYLARYWRFSPDANFYAMRAIVLLGLYQILMLISGPRLGLYPAAALLLFSLAILVPGRRAKWAFSGLALLPMTRLLFMEMLPFLWRNLAAAGQFINTTLAAFLVTAGLSLLVILWFFPLMLVASYGYSLLKPLSRFGKSFRHPAVGAGILLGLLAYGSYLYTLPAYNDIWRPSLFLRAQYSLPQKGAKLRIVGNEFFRNVSVSIDTLKQIYRGAVHAGDLPVTFQADWLEVTGHQSRTPGPQDTLHLDWQLKTSQPWYSLRLTVAADTSNLEVLNAIPVFNSYPRRAEFLWEFEPPESLHVTGQFLLAPEARVIRTVEATYLKPPLPVQISAGNFNVFYRTKVVWQDTLK